MKKINSINYGGKGLREIAPTHPFLSNASCSCLISQCIKNVNNPRNKITAPKMPSSSHSRTTTVRRTSLPILNSRDMAIPCAKYNRSLTSRRNHLTKLFIAVDIKTTTPNNSSKIVLSSTIYIKFNSMLCNKLEIIYKFTP